MSADARALLFASGAVLLEGETELGALPLWFAKSQAAQELGDPESLHLRFYNVGGDTHFKAPLTLLAALGIPWAIVCGGWLFDPQFRGTTSSGRWREPEPTLLVCSPSFTPTSTTRRWLAR